jgi:DNA-binding cell septation regulator SpoVG
VIIDELQVVPVKPQNGLIAFASCVWDNSLYLGNIGVYTSPSREDGYRLTYPHITLPNGKKINAFYPISKQAGNSIQEAIIKKYEEVTMKNIEGVFNERPYFA